MSGPETVVVVGQLPPPVTGFAHITACVVEEIRAGRQVDVADIGTTHRGIRKYLARVLKTARACLVLARRAVRARRKCYVACEGGLGLVYTIAIVGWARLLGYPLYLHHHSFNYIDAPKRAMHILLGTGGDLTHIFLCSGMRDKFERTYGRIVRSCVISNAAFVPLATLWPGEDAPGRPLVLGHLSNLTREKGLHLFLDLLRHEVARGKPVRGVLAGPVASGDDRALIDAACADLGAALTYRGPLYGPDKDAFYREVDVFVFPTTYVNEAQPTVLFEALAAGCKVLSFDRGCIRWQVGEDGLVLRKTENFVGGCAAWLDVNGTAIPADRPRTRARYLEAHDAARAVAANFLDT